MSALTLYTSLTTLPYTDEFGPGSGFLPTWCSFVLLTLGLLWIVETVRSKPVGKGKPFVDTRNLKKAVLLTLGLWAAPLLMDLLGFFTCLTLLGLFMIVGVERIGLKAGLLPLALTVAIIFTVFSLWLQMPFPKGLLI